MSRIKITTSIIKPGTRCVVANYRRKGLLEAGEIKRATCHVAKDGEPWWSYDIALDRKSANDATIWLYVSEDAIKAI